nr:hypothetical protein [Tanacetum cinerariifolium]
MTFLFDFSRLTLLKIKNGNSFKPVAQTTKNDAGTSTTHIPGPITTEEKAQKKNDVKAKSMLLKEDLNSKFLRGLPSEWNTHVMVWRNKFDLDTMSIADLYNNFKIVEQEVRGTTSSNSCSQNMAFVSSPSTNNTSEIHTAYGVSTAGTLPSTFSTQLVYEDLEQIHEDELEETDSKWQLALLSMRAKRFFLKTRKKITINGSDTTGFDKSKVECYNCHKMGHFARECRWPRNQDSRNRYEKSSRRNVHVKETHLKAMVAIDRVGFDWSYIAEDEAPTNMALMAFSDSEVYTNNTCLKTCLKSYETLKKQYDDLLIEFNKSEFNLVTYKTGLASVEEQLFFYKKNEVLFSKQIVVLKRDISYKYSKVSVLKRELEKFKQEKESNQPKVKNFDSSFKSLNKLIGSPIHDNSKKGLGYESYHAVLPPPIGLFSPLKLDLSNSGLEELKKPEIQSYRHKSCKTESKNASKDIPNELWESSDAPLVKDRVSYNKDCSVESPVVVEKKIVVPTITKAEFVRPKQQEKTVRKPVKGEKMVEELQVKKLSKLGLFKVPRRNNMYSFDMKNIVPKESLTCFVAKATLDESMLWHRRLGHINFKNINKLVKDNLVRGLPSKHFENDQTYVACLKGKQHKASCKFDGKADEGYFVRYSMNSKAFRVHNIRTKRVEENVHIEFLENKPIVANAGPKWMFDIDMLTESMNYVPFIAGLNSDDFAGSPLFDSSPKISSNAGKKHDEVLDKEKEDDFTNLESSIHVNPTPTTRTHKDHPLKQVIGSLNTPMDVKSAFLYERIKKEVYMCQPPGFKDLNHLDKVYVDDIIFGSTKKELCTEFERLMKDKFQIRSMREITLFLGLQVKQKKDGIFISHDKYVVKVLRKISFLDVKSANTPVDMEKTLVKDADGDDVYVHLYRSMIGSLMYLTTSRPDIIYLKGHPKLGLWYPIDSPFELVAYTDSDYARASLDTKSRTGGCQFLGSRLISWQCKKQTMVATSTTQAEYVAAASCCGQVLWIQNQMLDYGLSLGSKCGALRKKYGAFGELMWVTDMSKVDKINGKKKKTKHGNEKSVKRQSEVERSFACCDLGSRSLNHYPLCRLAILCHHPHAHDLESLLTISPSTYALLLDRFDNNVSFEEEVVYQRLRKTLTHVLELSSCIYLDDRAWGVLNFDSAGVRL